jgi:hypothetical protein
VLENRRLDPFRLSGVGEAALLQGFGSGPHAIEIGPQRWSALHRDTTPGETLLQFLQQIDRRSIPSCWAACCTTPWISTSRGAESRAVPRQ